MHYAVQLRNEVKENLFMTDNILKNIKSALDILLEKDRTLFEINVAERTIAHQLACYLKIFFKEWDVDCEYNRNMSDIKKLKDLNEECYKSKNINKNEFNVSPDIIIHKRNSKTNYIAIEIKKDSNTTPFDCDIEKLQAFKEQLGYEYALFIILNTGSNIPSYNIKPI